MKIGSFCTGYGGLDLAAEVAFDAQTAWTFENSPYPSTIISKHWPNATNYGDLRDVNPFDLPPVDVVTAGYPCQPFSHAGKRKGSDDDRHLWPHISRAISVLRPKYAVLENVRGHVSLGLSQVIADLSIIGYDTRWGLVRASDVGAPHQRARIFIVATIDFLCVSCSHASSISYLRSSIIFISLCHTSCKYYFFFFYIFQSSFSFKKQVVDGAAYISFLL